MQIRPFAPADEDVVVALWERCGLIRPWNDPHKDIRRKLGVQSELFLVGVQEGEIVAVAMAGYEGHRGWVNYLAVAPEHRRKGLARTLMREVERLLQQAGCPKLNLLVRTANQGVIEFYRQLGYVLDDVVCLSKRLEHDDAELSEPSP
jgi:ribosomal protein S18 acetylase RimI-like enzyme